MTIHEALLNLAEYDLKMFLRFEKNGKITLFNKNAQDIITFDNNKDIINFVIEFKENKKFARYIRMFLKNFS